MMNKEIPLHKKWVLVVFVFTFIFSGVSSFKAFAKEQHLIHGSLTNKYHFRTTGGSDHDHDVESLLSFNIGDLSTHKVSASLLAGVVVDLDQDNSTSYGSVYDTYNKNAVPRLYHAYLDAKDLGPINHLRVGRQLNYEFETLHYDGLFVETDPFYGFQLSAYGGVPVHLYENHMGFDVGDYMGGGALTWRPFYRLKFRFDFVHLKDKDNGFRSAVGDQTDSLLGGSAWLQLGKDHELYTRFTSFTDQVRDLKLGLNLNFPVEELHFRLNFYRLLKAYSVRVIDWDAYGAVGAYQPFTEGSLSVTKWLGEKFAMDAGFVLRKLDSDQTASAFNHGYKRAYLSASTYDVLFKGMTLSATGDYYNGDDSTLKNDNFGFSFDLDQRLLEDRLTIGAGTAFYLYRYNVALGNESSNVQSFYASIEGQLIKDTLKAKAKYDIEHNNYDNFHSLNASLIWNF